MGRLLGDNYKGPQRQLRGPEGYGLVGSGHESQLAVVVGLPLARPHRVHSPYYW